MLTQNAKFFLQKTQILPSEEFKCVMNEFQGRFSLGKILSIWGPVKIKSKLSAPKIQCQDRYRIDIPIPKIDIGGKKRGMDTSQVQSSEGQIPFNFKSKLILCGLILCILGLLGWRLCPFSLKISCWTRPLHLQLCS